jgi:hypothetical protein
MSKVRIGAGESIGEERKKYEDAYITQCFTGCGKDVCSES